MGVKKKMRGRWVSQKGGKKGFLKRIEIQDQKNTWKRKGGGGTKKTFAMAAESGRRTG